MGNVPSPLRRVKRWGQQKGCGARSVNRIIHAPLSRQKQGRNLPPLLLWVILNRKVRREEGRSGKMKRTPTWNRQRSAGNETSVSDEKALRCKRRRDEICYWGKTGSIKTAPRRITIRRRQSHLLRHNHQKRRMKKYKMLMLPVVKLGNGPKGSRKRRRDEIIKRILTHRLNYRLSRSSFTRYSLLGSSSCGQLAGETAYLWFLKPAARQDVTLHSRPLSGSVWASVCVNVLGGVHHWAGNAPRSHNSESAAYITAPSSSSTDLDSSTPPFT